MLGFLFGSVCVVICFFFARVFGLVFHLVAWFGLGFLCWWCWVVGIFFVYSFSLLIYWAYPINWIVKWVPAQGKQQGLDVWKETGGKQNWRNCLFQHQHAVFVGARIATVFRSVLSVTVFQKMSFVKTAARNLLKDFFCKGSVLIRFWALFLQWQLFVSIPHFISVKYFRKFLQANCLSNVSQNYRPTFMLRNVCANFFYLHVAVKWVAVILLLVAKNIM